MLGKSFLDVDTTTAVKEPAARAVAPLSPCQACKVRDIVICGSLDDAEISAISSIKSVSDVERNAPLFREGEPADHVFNVTAGVIRVYKLMVDGRRQITGFLFPGDFLGIANDAAYAYGAEAVTYASVCRFRRKDMKALLARFPKLEHRLLGIASHELAAAQEQMMLLGRKTARERVTSFLVMLSRRAATRGLPDNPLPLPMGRSDIGDYLGLTTETVSRTISGLRRDGVIADAPHGAVEILDRERLDEFSGAW